ncbi:hypothetical protein M2161_007627 [Streptomyces sp. SAI-133]|uniref:hypothetical protein n=1 Tax=unclassified Streptomyces TaxID=2593676 RepID=UPI002476D937|nr:hypothetical protein [Streptomyces sp. SAI-133]MDH6588521.1 hypothetical protein [Streptomyces sp. SAI-133]
MADGAHDRRPATARDGPRRPATARDGPRRPATDGCGGLSDRREDASQAVPGDACVCGRPPRACPVLESPWRQVDASHHRL